MTDPIDAFLAGYPSDVQAIGQSLRAMVKRAKPDAKEVLYARFNHFDYSLSGKMREGISSQSRLSRLKVRTPDRGRSIDNSARGQ
jgi:hypothetical protein